MAEEGGFGQDQLFVCQLDLCCAVFGGGVGGRSGSTLRVRGVLRSTFNVTQLIPSAEQPLPVATLRISRRGVVRLPQRFRKESRE